MIERTKKHWKHFRVRLSNYGMLVAICLVLFLLPALALPYQAHLFTTGISVIIILSIEATSQHFNASRRSQVLGALLAIWISRYTGHYFIKIIANFWLFVFFAMRVFMFIRDLAVRKEVNVRAILESINGYLLLGIALGFLVSLVSMISPAAFTFDFKDTVLDYYNPYYYAFVTMTTLGYGDCLPLTNAGKAISVFICLVGQLYLVTVVSMLIGRLLATQDIGKNQLQNK
ncbi:MAG: potassium channel family protein [Mangrovibacterium sp.]